MKASCVPAPEAFAFMECSVTHMQLSAFVLSERYFLQS